MNNIDQKLPSIYTLDEALEMLTNHNLYRVEEEQIIDWLKELRNYKQADGSLQTDSNILHEMVKTEYTKYILLLNNKSLQKVMRELNDEEIIKANKGIPNKEVWNKFLQNMSKRKQKIIEEDYYYMGPIRSIDCWLNQKKILSIIYHLIDTGEIKIELSSVRANYWAKQVEDNILKAVKPLNVRLLFQKLSHLKE